jgi:hypothetical protein
MLCWAHELPADASADDQFGLFLRLGHALFRGLLKACCLLLMLSAAKTLRLAHIPHVVVLLLCTQFTPPEVLDQLRHQISHYNELVNERARRSKSPDKVAAAAAAAAAAAHKQGYLSSGTSTSSKASPRRQPSAARSTSRQQQQQEVLGLAGVSKAAATAASLADQLAKCEALQRLHQQQQQPPQGLGQQALAQLGLQQLQDMTEVGQLLMPHVRAQQEATREVKQQLGALSSALQQYPQIANPTAINSLMEKQRLLEEKLEASRRESQVKELAHRNTLNVLRESTSTPRDTRYSQLQQENRILQQQQLSMQAQMQRMRELLVSRRQLEAGSSGELSSDVADEPAYRPVSRSLWGELQQGPGQAAAHHPSSGSTFGSSPGSSGSTGTSRSCTPSSGSDSGSAHAASGAQPHAGSQQQQQQRRQNSPSKVGSITANFDRQMAAGRAAFPLMQQQLSALCSPRAHQPGAVAPASAASHNAHVARQQQQQDLYAGVRAGMEVQHMRQLETERKQREHSQQQNDLLQLQNEKLTQQLQDCQAQLAALRQQLGERHSSSGGGAGSSGGAASLQDKQQKQQQLRLFKAESAVRELQDQLKQARQDKGNLQGVFDKLQQDASELKVSCMVLEQAVTADTNEPAETEQSNSRRCLWQPPRKQYTLSIGFLMFA